MSFIVMLISFFALILVGMPIAYTLISSTLVYILVSDTNFVILAQKMHEGLNTLSFMAIPFFILMGQLMLKGHLMRYLIEFVNVFFGKVSGAIAIVAIVVSLVMGSIVGMALAAAVAIGAIIIPIMKTEGYSPGFASAVVSSSCLLGPIMPPSVLMIIYCTAVGNTSITGLFLASVIPACLIALGQIVLVQRISAKRNYGTGVASTLSEKIKAFRKAIPVLFLPIIMLGSIFGGVCSVSEASALSAIYAFILTFVVYRTLHFRDLPCIFRDTLIASGMCMLFCAAGKAMAWAIANERLTQLLVEPLSVMPVWLFLLTINILLLVVGCFMEDSASVIIFGPIIAQIAWSMGIDPIHIGFIICVNLVIGLATPPFGVALFVTSPMAGVTVEETVKEAWPLMGITIAVLLLVTFIPEICLFLPRIFGYIT